MQKTVEFTVNSDLKKLAQERDWPLEVVSPLGTQIHYPSNTVEEDLLYAIRHWAQLLQYSSVERAQLVREEQFHHLHCVTDYEVAEAFRCLIPNALVINPTGLVITSDLEIIRQSLDRQKTNINTDINLNARQIKHKFESDEGLPGTYVSLLSYWSYTLNFAHWLMDCLPKLALVDSLDDDIKENIRYIIPDNSPPYIIDSLRLLGIQKEQTVCIQEESIIVENLILCCAAKEPGRPNKTHLLAIKNKLLSYVVNKETHRPAFRRVYISRSQSSRGIVNEEDILKVLRKYGFEVVLCEEISLAKQISVFSDAQVILGSHGAGMYNQIFCQSGVNIIEIYNKEYWHHSSRIISSFMGHKHWHIFGENVGKDWETWVDPLKLEKILNLAISAHREEN